MLPNNTLIELLQEIQTIKKRVDIIEPRESLGPNLWNGELYTHDAALTVSLPVANTPVVSTGWTEGLESPDDYIIMDGANGTITIGTLGTGRYRIHCGASFSADKANIVVHAYVQLNGAELNNVGWRRDIGNANQIGNANAIGHVDLVAGNVLTFAFESDTNNTTLTLEHGELDLFLIEKNST